MCCASVSSGESTSLAAVQDELTTCRKENDAWEKAEFDQAFFCEDVSPRNMHVFELICHLQADV